MTAQAPTTRKELPAGPDGVRRGWPVETPIGTMYLNPVGWGVLIDNSSNTIPERPGRPYLTVRGRELTATIGFRNDGELERCYVSKARTNEDAPPTFRAAVLEHARAAVETFSAEHPELIARGAYDYARLAHEIAVDRLAEARETFAQARRDERARRRARDAAAAELAHWTEP